MVVAPAWTATVIILDEEVGVGAGAVFGGELDVVGEGAGEADGIRRPGRGPGRG